MNLMLPIEKTYNPDQIDGKLSAFSKLPRVIQVSLTAPIEEHGVATVNGIPLSRCEQIQAVGFYMLLVPVGEVAREYDSTYTVKLEGFKGKNGKKFPTCTFKLKTTSRNYQDTAYAEHDEQTLQAAREGMVLLKNQGNLLPLGEESVLNCFGEGQHTYRISATGASLINPRWAPNFMQAVEDNSHFTINQELAAYYKSGNRVPDKELLLRAKEQSDTALLFITRHSGEGQDNRPIRGQYYLTEEELAMAKAITSVFEKTVLILNTGYPIEMSWTRELNITSILFTGFAGMLSAYALMEILDGRTNPSGRLSCTWPWEYYDNIVSKNQPVLKEGIPALADNEAGVRIYYEEDIYVGYRYFDTFGKAVAYPFGHGLSYTTFALAGKNFCRDAGGVHVNIEVKNTGAVAGKEVVQLYLTAPQGKLEKPAHVLVAFDKTRLLAPGDSQVLHLDVENTSMASFDEERGQWVMEQGEYVLSVGTLGNLQPVGSFTLTEDKVLKTVQHFGCPVEPIEKLTQEKGEVDGSRSKIVPLEERIRVSASKKAYEPQPLPAYTGKTITWPEVLENPSLLDAFVAQMSLKELAKLNVCAGSRWAPWQDGCAGSTPVMKKYKLPSFVVSDANAGLNIKKSNVGFPVSSVIASTFNKEIAYTVGRVIAEESLENGIFLNLGPGMNLQRNLLNGRHPEYFSEDPFLAGTMAGYHGKGLEENGLGCCYKHLFCNGSDLSRKGSHSIVSERALRELYFRVFERAFEIQKPSTVMTSYNAMNGMYPAENAELLQGYVRGELGFEGFIMSDWDAYDTIDAVEMVKAGNCWITAGGAKWVKTIQKTAQEGKISRAVLENNVRWLIKILLKWGK